MIQNPSLCPTCLGYLHYQRIQFLNELWVDCYCRNGHYWTIDYLNGKNALAVKRIGGAPAEMFGAPSPL